MANLEGQQLGAYQVLQQMGTGGMATVYRAYHARLDRHVAIKVMHEAFQQDAGFLARFEREAQIVARLEHPNIVPVYDFADLNGTPYLVMKHIEGQTLKARLFRQLPTLDMIKRVLPPIADALDYAHRQGILHRDIKPSNILLDAQGTPYLSDFGLARIAQLGESTLSQDVVLGTPQYISPEQAMGRRDLTPATDLYSFGVVIYEMIVGRVPFSSETAFATIHDHIYRQLPLPSSINPAFPSTLDDTLMKALAKRPEDRFESAKAMVYAVVEALSASGLPALDPDRGEQAEENLDRLRHSDEAALADERTTPLSAAPVRFMTTPQPPLAPQPPQILGIPSSGRKQFDAKGRKVEVSWDLGDFNFGRIGDNVEEALENVGEHLEAAFEGTKYPEDYLKASDPASIRMRIEQEIKTRNEFFSHLGAFIIAQAVMWTIFGVTEGNGVGAGFPWPVLVLFGWGSGLVAHGIETWDRTGRRLRRRLETVENALVNEFGPNWSERASKKQIKAVRRKAEKPINARLEFAQHLGVFVMINSLLWTIFGLTNDGGIDGFLMSMAEDGVDISLIGQAADFPWPLIPMLAWGFGLFMHGLQTAGMEVRERAIQRELVREQARLASSGKAKREALPPDTLAMSVDDLDRKAKRGPRITADGEFTDSLAAELREDERRRRRRS